PPRVHLVSHSSSGYIVLRFPGQHYAEQAIWDRGPQLDSQQANDGKPPPPATYPLWRDASAFEKGQSADGYFHHNDDLAFLRFAPWRIPEATPGFDGAQRRR